MATTAPEIEGDFDFYLRFVKPLVLNLNEPNDRALAAAWVQKLRDENAGTAELRTDYLKLLLFVLQRKQLIGVFSENPNQYETLEKFPDTNLHDVARDLLEAEEDFRRKQQDLGGAAGDFPPYSTEHSADLLEYSAAQDIPNFGVHAFYAVSNEPLPKWERTDKAVFPRGASSTTERNIRTDVLSRTSSATSEPALDDSESKDKLIRKSKLRKKQRSPKSKNDKSLDEEGKGEGKSEEKGPHAKFLEDGKTPPRRKSLAEDESPSPPLGSVTKEPTRESPTWGSNLIGVSEPPVRETPTEAEIISEQESRSSDSSYPSLPYRTPSPRRQDEEEEPPQTPYSPLFPEGETDPFFLGTPPSFFGETSLAEISPVRIPSPGKKKQIYEDLEAFDRLISKYQAEEVPPAKSPEAAPAKKNVKTKKGAKAATSRSKVPGGKPSGTRSATTKPGQRPPSESSRTTVASSQRAPGASTSRLAVPKGSSVSRIPSPGTSRIPSSSKVPTPGTSRIPSSSKVPTPGTSRIAVPGGSKMPRPTSRIPGAKGSGIPKPGASRVATPKVPRPYSPLLPEVGYDEDPFFLESPPSFMYDPTPPSLRSFERDPSLPLRTPSPRRPERSIDMADLSAPSLPYRTPSPRRPYPGEEADLSAPSLPYRTPSPRRPRPGAAVQGDYDLEELKALGLTVGDLDNSAFDLEGIEDIKISDISSSSNVEGRPEYGVKDDSMDRELDEWDKMIAELEAENAEDIALYGSPSPAKKKKHLKTLSVKPARKGGQQEEGPAVVGFTRMENVDMADLSAASLPYRTPSPRRPAPGPASTSSGISVPGTSRLKPPGVSRLRPPGASGIRPPGTSGIRPPGASGIPLAGSSGIRPPSASRIRPPGTSGIRPPGTSGIRAPGASGIPLAGSSSGIRPPSASRIRPPGTSGIRPPGTSGIRPPGTSGIRPPGASGIRPPGASRIQAPKTPARTQVPSPPYSPIFPEGEEDPFFLETPPSFLEESTLPSLKSYEEYPSWPIRTPSPRRPCPGSPAAGGYDLDELKELGLNPEDLKDDIFNLDEVENMNLSDISVGATEYEHPPEFDVDDTEINRDLDAWDKYIAELEAENAEDIALYGSPVRSPLKTLSVTPVGDIGMTDLSAPSLPYRTPSPRRPYPGDVADLSAPSLPYRTPSPRRPYPGDVADLSAASLPYRTPSPRRRVEEIDMADLSAASIPYRTPSPRRPVPGPARIAAPGASRIPGAGVSRIRPPGTSGIRPPGASGIRPPGTSGIRPPGTSGIRPPGTSGIRPPGSGIRPPGASRIQPPKTPAPIPPPEVFYSPIFPEGEEDPFFFETPPSFLDDSTLPSLQSYEEYPSWPIRTPSPRRPCPGSAAGPCPGSPAARDYDLDELKELGLDAEDLKDDIFNFDEVDNMNLSDISMGAIEYEHPPEFDVDDTEINKDLDKWDRYIAELEAEHAEDIALYGSPPQGRKQSPVKTLSVIPARDAAGDISMGDLSAPSLPYRTPSPRKPKPAVTRSRIAVPGASGIRPPGASRIPGSRSAQIPGASRIQAPTGIASGSRLPGPSRLQAPGSTRLPIPGASRIQAPGASRIPPPGVSRIQPPGASGIRLPGAPQVKTPGVPQPKTPGAARPKTPGVARPKTPGAQRPKTPVTEKPSAASGTKLPGAARSKKGLSRLKKPGAAKRPAGPPGKPPESAEEAARRQLEAEYKERYKHRRPDMPRTPPMFSRYGSVMGDVEQEYDQSEFGEFDESEWQGGEQFFEDKKTLSPRVPPDLRRNVTKQFFPGIERQPEGENFFDDEIQPDLIDDEFEASPASERSPKVTREDLKKKVYDTEKEISLLKESSPAEGGLPITTPRLAPTPVRPNKSIRVETDQGEISFEMPSFEGGDDYMDKLYFESPPQEYYGSPGSPMSPTEAEPFFAAQDSPKPAPVSAASPNLSEFYAQQRLLEIQAKAERQLMELEDSPVKTPRRRSPITASPKTPRQTPVDIFNQSITEELPPAIRPPKVVPGWKTPPHLEMPKRSPRAEFLPGPAENVRIPAAARDILAQELPPYEMIYSPPPLSPSDTRPSPQRSPSPRGASPCAGSPCPASPKAATPRAPGALSPGSLLFQFPHDENLFEMEGMPEEMFEGPPSPIRTPTRPPRSPESPLSSPESPGSLHMRLLLADLPEYLSKDEMDIPQGRGVRRFKRIYRKSRAPGLRTLAEVPENYLRRTAPGMGTHYESPMRAPAIAAAGRVVDDLINSYGKDLPELYAPPPASSLPADLPPTTPKRTRRSPVLPQPVEEEDLFAEEMPPDEMLYSPPPLSPGEGRPSPKQMPSPCGASPCAASPRMASPPRASPPRASPRAPGAVSPASLLFQFGPEDEDLFEMEAPPEALYQGSPGKTPPRSPQPPQPPPVSPAESRYSLLMRMFQADFPPYLSQEYMDIPVGKSVKRFKRLERKSPAPKLRTWREIPDNYNEETGPFWEQVVEAQTKPFTKNKKLRVAAPGMETVYESPMKVPGVTIQDQIQEAQRNVQEIIDKVGMGLPEQPLPQDLLGDASAIDWEAPPTEFDRPITEELPPAMQLPLVVPGWTTPPRLKTPKVPRRPPLLPGAAENVRVRSEDRDILFQERAPEDIIYSPPPLSPGEYPTPRPSPRAPSPRAPSPRATASPVRTSHSIFDVAPEDDLFEDEEPPPDLLLSPPRSPVRSPVRSPPRPSPQRPSPQRPSRPPQSPDSPVESPFSLRIRLLQAGEPPYYSLEEMEIPQGRTVSRRQVLHRKSPAPGLHKLHEVPDDYSEEHAPFLAQVEGAKPLNKKDKRIRIAKPRVDIVHEAPMDVPPYTHWDHLEDMKKIVKEMQERHPIPPQPIQYPEDLMGVEDSVVDWEETASILEGAIPEGLPRPIRHPTVVPGWKTPPRLVTPAKPTQPYEVKLRPTLKDVLFYEMPPMEMGYSPPPMASSTPFPTRVGPAKPPSPPKINLPSPPPASPPLHFRTMEDLFDQESEFLAVEMPPDEYMEIGSEESLEKSMRYEVTPFSPGERIEEPEIVQEERSPMQTQLPQEIIDQQFEELYNKSLEDFEAFEKTLVGEGPEETRARTPPSRAVIDQMIATGGVINRQIADLDRSPTWLERVEQKVWDVTDPEADLPQANMFTPNYAVLFPEYSPPLPKLHRYADQIEEEFVPEGVWGYESPKTPKESPKRPTPKSPSPKQPSPRTPTPKRPSPKSPSPRPSPMDHIFSVEGVDFLDDTELPDSPLLPTTPTTPPTPPRIEDYYVPHTPIQSPGSPDGFIESVIKHEYTDRFYDMDRKLMKDTLRVKNRLIRLSGPRRPEFSPVREALREDSPVRRRKTPAGELQPRELFPEEEDQDQDQEEPPGSPPFFDTSMSQVATDQALSFISPPRPPRRNIYFPSPQRDIFDESEEGPGDMLEMTPPDFAFSPPPLSPRGSPPCGRGSPCQRPDYQLPMPVYYGSPGRQYIRTPVQVEAHLDDQDMPDILDTSLIADDNFEDDMGGFKWMG